MRRFGLPPDDTGKILKLGNTGGYILKTDSERLSAMFDRHSQELTEAMNDTDFAVGAFRYQLNNQEYCVNFPNRGTPPLTLNTPKSRARYPRKYEGLKP